jgi:two-component system, sensor histidine kinase YesM
MKNKIRNQLILTYVLLTIIPVMIISIYIVNVYSSSIIEMERSSLIRNQEKIHKNIIESMKTYTYMLEFIKKDYQLQEASQKGLIKDVNLETLLTGYLKQVNYILSISLFNAERNFISSDVNGNLKSEFDVQSIMNAIRTNPNQIVLKSYKPGNSPIVSANSEYIDTVHLFTRIRPENRLEDQQTKDTNEAVVNVMISSTLFEEAVKNVDLGDSGYFYVLNEQGEVVYSPVASKELDKTTVNEYLTYETLIDNTGWTLHAVKPIQGVLEHINNLRNNLIKLFLISIIILFAITVKFSNYIINPIKRLQALMKQAEIGNLDIRYSGKINNEINDLGLGFNKMISKINELIDQVKKEQQAKKYAEIAMLQSNIKPHFLYNTLETIRWMSKKYQANDISETVNALATFFRVSLSKGKESIPLSEEIKHVESYLQIQKLRYSDILDYSIEVADHLNKYIVPKLIIQPFVENSLYHGIKETGERGCIKVQAFEENENIVIVIEDDGQGISEDKLNTLRTEIDNLSDFSYISYGIKNVHQRIRLINGVKYGVTLESKKGVGTKVIIILPKSRNEEMV